MMTFDLRIVAAVLTVTTLGGCVAAQSGLPRSVREGREHIRADTYRVLDNGLGAAGDGYTFLNEQFRFEFARDFDSVEGYRTAPERFERGKAASDFLNGGYEFVRDIFGIEATQQIGVVISPALDGDPNDARTQITWLEHDGLIVTGSQTATMYFGATAFEQHRVLAHELTHALLDVYGLPAWLGEGIATLVETDYATRGQRELQGINLAPLGLDDDGYNVLQSWRGDGSALPFRSEETYGAAYAIVSEMRRRFGSDVFPRIFREIGKSTMRVDNAHVTATQIADAIETTTGLDARPFFHDIRFQLDVPQ